MTRIFILSVFTFIFFTEHTCLPATSSDVVRKPWETESFGCSYNWECVSIANCYAIVDLQDHTAYPCSNYGEPLKICCPPATVSPALSSDQTIKLSTSSTLLTTKSPPTKITTTTPKITTSGPTPRQTTNEAKWLKIPKELRNKTTLLPTKCGVNNLEDKIIGGVNAEIGEFPWIALIGNTVNGKVEFWCGGSLISKRYILTAAHCTQVGALKPTIIRLGEWNVTSEKDCVYIQKNITECADAPVDIPVEEIIVHERYGDENLPSFQNDIALIRLAQDVKDTDFISPICLHTDTVRSMTGYTISGWGVSEASGKIPNPVLQKAKLSLYDFRECNSISPPQIKPLAKSQFCAGGGTENTCKGDSGGPLTYLENGLVYLKGIVSLGLTGVCEEEKPGIYTEVTTFMRWILKNIR